MYVQATDETGLIAQSQVVQVNVRDLNSNTPRVQMGHPLPVGSGDVVNDVSVGSEMYLNATATVGGGGTIERVNFYINSQLIGSSSSAYNNTYSLYFAPTTPGNYVMFAEAVDNRGNRSHSAPLLLDVGPLQAQLPKVKILPIADRFQDMEVGSRITVAVEVDSGLVEVSQVNFYVNGVLVTSQDTANENDARVYTASFPLEQSGVVLIGARAVEIDPLGLTYDNWSLAKPVGVRVLAAAGNRAFVDKVYLSLMGAAPSQAFSDDAVLALNNGQLSREQFVYLLMEGEAYLPTIRALMARYLLTGEWPTRAMLISDAASAATSLAGLVKTHLPTFQSRFWGNQRIPDGFSTDKDYREFFKLLFKNKHGVDPTSAQSDRAVMQMKVYFMEDFIAELVRDTDATPFGSGSISTILGIPNPPNTLLEDRAFAAALYSNLLKVKPTVEEVESLRTLTKVQQIEKILADPRF
jgi:hypothetical protein